MCREVKFQLTYSSGGAIDASVALREVNSIFHQETEGAPPVYGMATADLYEPPPPSYQSAQNTHNNFADTNMFVSPAMAPYAGVYQRQPTGLPRAEFVPQYSEMPFTDVTHSPQLAYQNNGCGGQMYIPQVNGEKNYPMPPSYEQSQNGFQEKKSA
ncbi:unnamed protein product [Adineta ricciae]|uniref:Uncharacterized protein n=1 Tax=Adineta ricciae TaxID=249248 RepID=A0A813QDI0_ADIRI|nr:unnamed protein product [Adineta ricciae]